MRSRSNLAIHLPKEEDELYHQTKVEAMMTAEEEFWRDNPDEYDKYLKYEIEEKISHPTKKYYPLSNTHFYLIDAMKPLALLLLIQSGVFFTIIWWNLNFMFVL